MRTRTLVLFLTVLLLLIATRFAAGSVLFYGGDFDPNAPYANGLPNENDATVSGNPYGAATYQNFVSWGGAISGLFTNDFMISPTLKGFPRPYTAYWEIRSGVFEGYGGTLLASGSGVDTITATGRSGFGYLEYTNEVRAVVNLMPGTYWFAVVPVCTACAGRSWNSNTFGRNSVGTQLPNQQYFNSATFGANFTNANNQGVFQTFSSGVLVACAEGSTCNYVAQSDVPEPSSLILLGSAALVAAGLVRRRFS